MSWNTSVSIDRVHQFVSLLVRLWVEILHKNKCNPKAWSASSWGCELKFHSTYPPTNKSQSASSWGCELKYIPFRILLILTLSASSWGCELKFKWDCYCDWNCGQPPREAVSWNAHIMQTIWHWQRQPPREAVSWNSITYTPYLRHIVSASSWGCELKYFLAKQGAEFQSSASSWGCELKYVMDNGKTTKQPSASSWGCELK